MVEHLAQLPQTKVKLLVGVITGDTCFSIQQPHSDFGGAGAAAASIDATPKQYLVLASANMRINNSWSSSGAAAGFEIQRCCYHCY